MSVVLLVSCGINEQIGNVNLQSQNNTEQERCDVRLSVVVENSTKSYDIEMSIFDPGFENLEQMVDASALIYDRWKIVRSNRIFETFEINLKILRELAEENNLLD